VGPSFVDVGQGDGVVMRIGSKIVVSDAGQFKYENIDTALHALGQSRSTSRFSAIHNPTTTPTFSVSSTSGR